MLHIQLLFWDIKNVPEDTTTTFSRRHVESSEMTKDISEQNVFL
jgi:hypothetical protein